MYQWLLHPIQSFRIWRMKRLWDRALNKAFTERELPASQRDQSRKFPIVETPKERDVESLDLWASSDDNGMDGVQRLQKTIKRYEAEKK